MSDVLISFDITRLNLPLTVLSVYRAPSPVPSPPPLPQTYQNLTKFDPPTPSTPQKANTDKASKLYLVGVFRYISLSVIFIGGDDA